MIVTLLLNIAGLLYALGINELFFFPVAMATLISVFNKNYINNLFKNRSVTWYLWCFFGLSLMVSCLVNYEIELIYTAFGIYSSILIFNYFNLKFKNLKNFLSLSLLVHSIVLFFCIIINEVALINYVGFFRNPNSLGLYSATALAILIAFIMINKKMSIFLKILMYMLGLSFVFLIIISSSRTAVLAGFIIIVNWFYINKEIRHRIFYMLLILAFSLYIYSTELFYNSIILKNEYYQFLGDPLNARSDKWWPAIENPTFFGHGRLATIKDGVGESIYISLLHQFGLVPLILFFTIIIYSIRKSIISSFNKPEYGIYVLPIGLLFLIQGFTGSIFGHSIYYLWIIVTAINSKNEKRIIFNKRLNFES